MQIEWTTLAETDLKHIFIYISRDNQPAAVKVITTIRRAVRGQLLTSPFSGRVGRVKDTRELIIPQLPYMVAYRITNSGVQVLRILHTAQRWPKSL